MVTIKVDGTVFTKPISKIFIKKNMTLTDYVSRSLVAVYWQRSQPPGLGAHSQRHRGEAS